MFPVERFTDGLQDPRCGLFDRGGIEQHARRDMLGGETPPFSGTAAVASFWRHHSARRRDYSARFAETRHLFTEMA
jgi:hypothetical protein